MKTFEVKVAGVSFENRQNIIKLLSGDEPMRLVPEPENKYDPNAIAVHVGLKSGVFHVGYIPKEYAKRISPHMEGEPFMCKRFFVTGGFELATGDIANYGLTILVELPDDTFRPDILPF